MYFNQKTIVYLNGQWIKAADAKTDLYSQTLHYGCGVFEGIRAYKTESGVQIFKAREHYERLLYSADRMSIKLDYTVDQLIELSYQLLQKNEFADAYIRPLAYVGANMSLHTPEDTNLLLCAWEWGLYLGKELVNVMTSSYQRPDPRSCYVDAKVSGHYINSILATNEAKRKGYDEALLTDINGYIAEGPGCNFFFQQDGVLFTSPTGNILPGITRATVIELAKESGISLEERFFTPEEVEGADGAFFTGTAAEVAGIASLNDVKFSKKWEDTLGYQLSLAYKDLVLCKNAKNIFLTR